MEEKKQTLTEKIKRLEVITTELEKPELDLQDSLKLYEEGMGLVKSCTEEIEQAQATILKLTPENIKVEVTEDLEDLEG